MKKVFQTLTRLSSKVRHVIDFVISDSKVNPIATAKWSG